jgi:hypothetical protein
LKIKENWKPILGIYVVIILKINLILILYEKMMLLVWIFMKVKNKF